MELEPFAADRPKALPATPTNEPREALIARPVLLDLWDAVRRWRKVIAGIFAVCLALAILAWLVMPSLYTARGQIEVNREKRNVTSVEGVEPVGEGRDLEFYATQYALLKAESLAARVVRKLNLAKDETFYAAHGLDMHTGLVGTDANQRAADVLLRHVTIKPIHTSRLIDIEYTSRAPEMSARIVNAWVAEFIAASFDRQVSQTAEARRFLEGQLQELLQKVEQSERDVAVYAANQGIVSLGTSSGVQGSQGEARTLAAVELEAASQALSQAKADRIAAQSRMQGQTNGTNAEELSSQTMASLRTRRAEAAAEYSRLLVQFEPGYPAAQALRQQVAELDRALAQESARFASSRRQTFADADRHERMARSAVDQLRGELERQRKASVKYNTFQRETDTNQQLYNALLQRYKDIGAVGAVGASNVAIVDSARVPERPAMPSLTFNLALGLCAALGLAAIAVFLLSQVDRGFRDAEDAGAGLDLPILGEVPAVGNEVHDQLEDPGSPVSDAYLDIRSLLALTTSSGLPRSLVVTSAEQNEGKSTTAIALAIMLARSNLSVLLVDGDLRSPSLHRLLGVANGSGLANLLAGDENFAAHIRETGHAGLSLLPAGPLPPSPAELLGQDRVKALFERLAAQFEYVLIDSPPTVGLADAPLLARVADGCVLVIEAGRTQRRAIKQAIEKLRLGQGRLLGGIVTKVSLRRNRYAYGREAD